MNRSIRRKLMKAKNQPGSIEQWFKRIIILDHNWRESKREEERLRGKRETNGAPAQGQISKKHLGNHCYGLRFG